MKRYGLFLTLILIILSSCNINVRTNKETIKIDIFTENLIEYTYFGYYPQHVVSDNTIISELSKLVLTEDDKCYSLDDKNYLKIVSKPLSASYTFSDESVIGFSNVYYFELEPIKWQVISKDEGKYELVACSILDNCCFSESLVSTFVNGNEIFSNNYEYSNLRSFLNEDFLKLAFSSEELEVISKETIDNSVESTNNSSNKYACNNTNDMVTAYSVVEATNNSSYYLKQVSDYALAKGCYVNSLGNGYWWLRSPNASNPSFASIINDLGKIEDSTEEVTSNIVGIVPKIVVKQ